MKVPNLDFLAEELSALDAKQHKATQKTKQKPRREELPPSGTPCSQISHRLCG